MRIGDKTCNFVVLCRSPSQSQDVFESFCESFERTLDNLAQNNLFLLVAIGGFNAKSTNWCANDQTSFEGNKIEHITSQFGLSQIINEPTHILDSSSSCIDLIFTSHPNLVIESGVHPSLHQNCHHQIIYAKFNLQIFYPPPYCREIWHYQDANIDMIRRVISQFNWDKSFSNTNVNEKVYICSHTILNILSNFISHEYIICNERDPPWFNSKIKHLIQEKNNAYQLYRNNKTSACFRNRLNFLQDSLKNLIEMSKQKYFSRIASKLTMTRKSPKTYCFLLKVFLNNKKIPIILPLFHENKFVTDFKEKAELFNAFFAKECSLIDSNSSLPKNLIYFTEKRLSKIRFSEDDIAKIIQNLILIKRTVMIRSVFAC